MIFLRSANWTKLRLWLDLLDEVVGGGGHRLGHQLHPELVDPVELHEKPDGPEVVGFVVFLRPLSLQVVPDRPQV